MDILTSDYLQYYLNLKKDQIFKLGQASIGTLCSDMLTACMARPCRMMLQEGQGGHMWEPLVNYKSVDQNDNTRVRSATEFSYTAVI